MKSIVTTFLIFVYLGVFGQIGKNNDAIGLQFSGSLLLFNDCCFTSLIHSDPKLELGYRIALISRHTSGSRFYHDFQLSYSKESIGYTKNRNNNVEEEYLKYEAYHFTYYFGIAPIGNIPFRVFVGHNVGHIVHNFGDNVESELFGLNFKIELPFLINKIYSIEPVVDFSWTYNKTTSYNNRVVFGLNLMRRI